MTFNEANTVEAFIRDRLAGATSAAIVKPELARPGRAISDLGWHFVGPADLPRHFASVGSPCFVEVQL